MVWGEPGTNGQHAFFQLIHQGTEIVPVDFLVAAMPTNADRHHHELLVANCLAQGEALMRGRTSAEAKALTIKQGASEAEANRLAPHKRFSGSRPTSTFLYRELDPRALGRLIALYEHKVFTEGAVWDINSFDQWGVELGKELASSLAPIVADAGAATSAIDSSTAGLVAHLRALRQRDSFLHAAGGDARLVSAKCCLPPGWPRRRRSLCLFTCIYTHGASAGRLPRRE